MFDEEYRDPYPPKPRKELTLVWLSLAAIAVVVFVSARIFS